MSIATLMGRPCTIIRRQESATEDRYGNLQHDEILVSSTCELQQEVRSETDQGTLAETTWIAFFPIGTNIQAEDAVEIGSYEYEVVGDPWQADTGSTAVHHVEATLRRTGGVEDVS